MGWRGIGFAMLGLVAAFTALPAAGAQAPPDSSSPFRITEVLAASGQGAQEALFEWVELQNQSAAPASLAGWTLEDNRAADALPDVTVPAGGFVIVSANPDPAALLPDLDAVDRQTIIFVALPDGRIGNGLANSGDRVLLRDPDARAADGVSWGNDHSLTNLPTPPRGQTLARSADGEFRVGDPSPGSISTPPDRPAGEPPPLRITEIFANAGQGTDDAAFEWVEIFNPTADTVDLAGWTISDNAGTDALPATLLGPGRYVVVAASGRAAPGVAEVIVLADGRIGNGLANGGDHVSLVDGFGRLVDSVDYAGPPLPLPEPGRSIALTNDGWVLNTSPSPGAPGVTPLLATLAPSSPAADGPTGAIEQDDEDGGIPAWVFVAILVGVPAAFISAQRLWLSRRRIHAQSVARLRRPRPRQRQTARPRDGKPDDAAATGPGAGGDRLAPSGRDADPRGPRDAERHD